MRNNLSVVIMAAGLGTRMKSALPKVLHHLDSTPLIIHVLKKALSLRPDSVTVIVGHKGKMVESAVREWAGKNKLKTGIVFVEQKLLKGSGRAVQEASESFKKYGTVFILSGDAPLTEPGTISAMLKKFRASSADCMVLTCEVEDTKSYGRIVRDPFGGVKAIVEAPDASEDELKIKEVNSGIYVFKSRELLKAVSRLEPKGPKKEYYLTDSVENIMKSGGKVMAFKIKDELQITGINSRRELYRTSRQMINRKLEKLMAGGVTIMDPSNTYISPEAKISRDTVVYPGCVISGSAVIGKNCKIGPYAVISDARIMAGTEIKPFCCIYESLVKNDCVLGPFSHIRPASEIGPSAKVGNFSEIKKSRIGRGSKVPHLSYIGDTEMGEKVNIGAGTITCNYDGVKKSKTVIQDGAFVGSNANLVAPVKVGKNALIGAGSTITGDVPDEKLAIARARQVIKEKKR
ncbi:MAG: UDP-N-acetylglucosamine diphosphorylase/glucosamine-1-phosphate N-acetyltransferase [Elusimicrobia bacterium CG08_land_8_20_14_0_20_51_18]|nr:MAG: UDP-N-acetylglucosamine diphosphorylase/glucosamine-1-phosphate N-acetyltransferase [Elusimicrobia bacterium CG08_land_8_20_14_0_20_51_18]